MSARHLVVGLDGADLRLIQQLGAERLPHLHRLMANGVFAPLQSVRPPATLPNWATFLTGVDPGSHGVFDFTTRNGYRVQFSAGSVRATATWIARLDQLGLQCACLFFPGAYPPERLQHGLYVSGWDAPVAFEADRSFVWPPDAYEQLRQRFGAQRFGDVDEFDTHTPGWHERLPLALQRRVEQRTAMCEALLAERAWDVFAVYFGESDTAAHHLWALHDPRSPRRPPAVSRGQEAGLSQVYMALDRALHSLWERAGASRCELTVVSDHGFGGASDRVLYLNRALAEAGLLHFKRSGPLAPLAARALAARAKELALTRLPPWLRDRLFRLGSTVLPSILESAARFGNIDMDRTRVFSDELNYFPALHLNLRGREPAGIVAPDEVEALVEQVRRVLLSLRDPATGEAVVTAVHRREALFTGPCVARAPDLLLDLHLPGGYSYNLMPSAGAPAGAGPFRSLSLGEYLGRKGRSLQGSHREQGFYLAAGPSVAARGEITAHIADAAATVLARIGIAPDPAAAGQVLPIAAAHPQAAHATADPQTEANTLASSPACPVLPAAPPVGPTTVSEQGEAKVAARLRRLGYIE